MAKKREDNSKLILIGAGIIIAWPLIKGILSLFNIAGSVLALPGDLARALKQAAGGIVEDQVYDQVYSIVSQFTYNPNEDRAVYLMKFLEESDIRNKNYLIDLFKQQKNEGVNALVRGARMAVVLTYVNKILKGWL